MNAIAFLETAAETPVWNTQLLAEDACRDCGVSLHDGDEFRCEGCADLAAHNGECRDCGRVLPDSAVDAGTCTDCLA